MTWEIVSESKGENTERMPVPGGWIYRTVIYPYHEGESASVAMVFVPVPVVAMKEWVDLR